MKPNLSKLIKLDRIPERYYAPKNDVEKAALCREEKINVDIYESVLDGAREEACRIAEFINHTVAAKGKCVLAIGAGKATHVVYEQLINLYHDGKVSFKKVIVFNLNEFYPSIPKVPSTIVRLKNVFLDHIDINPKNIHTLDTNVEREDIYKLARDYEAEIERAGGIDMVVCEIGPTGNLGFNGSSRQREQRMPPRASWQ